MLKKVGMILLALNIILLLSSCHIEQKDVETISRTNNVLRVYQPNDFITYNITAVTNPNIFNRGTLRIQWEQTADLTNPIDGTTKYTVLKETTTLIYEPDSTETNATIIRYISQDNNGNITLYAIDDGTGLYWLYDQANTGNLSSDIILPVIFNSPMTIGDPPPNTPPVEFAVMRDCGNPTIGRCEAEVYSFNNSFNIVGDSTVITTNLGTFSNPFEITFIGGTTPSNSPALSFPGDIRDICGTSADTITHNGNMFIMPKIGVIQMSHSCNVIGGNLVNYTISISDTNIF